MLSKYLLHLPLKGTDRLMECIGCYRVSGIIVCSCKSVTFLRSFWNDCEWYGLRDGYVREQTFSDARFTSFYCLCLFNINSYVYVDCNIDKKLYKFSLYMFSCIVFVTMC